MARWILDCSDCDEEFTYSEIDTDRQPPPIDAFAWIIDKPKIAEAGIPLECPKCKRVSVYKRNQLMYRAK
jgi:hypothetical protein